MELLIEMGYVQYKDQMPKLSDIHNTFYKKINSHLVECEENGNKISFQCIQYSVYSHLPPQYEMSITFCKNGKWWNIKAYSINQSDFTKEMVEKTEAELINIFLAI